MQRWPILLILLIAPVAVHADTATASSTAASSSANLQQGQATTGSSPATLNALQPAGAGSTSLQSTGSSSVSPLQSMDSSDLGSSTDAAQSLQQIDAGSESKLLVSGEADQPQSLNSSPDLAWLGDTLLVLLAATAITAITWFIDRLRP